MGFLRCLLIEKTEKPHFLFWWPWQVNSWAPWNSPGPHWFLSAQLLFSCSPHLNQLHLWEQKSVLL